MLYHIQVHWGVKEAESDVSFTKPVWRNTLWFYLLKDRISITSPQTYTHMCSNFSLFSYYEHPQIPIFVLIIDVSHTSSHGICPSENCAFKNLKSFFCSMLKQTIKPLKFHSNKVNFFTLTRRYIADYYSHANNKFRDQNKMLPFYWNW